MDTQELPEENKRPEFLTIICILTFIGSAYAILSGLFGLMFESYLINNMIESAEVQENLADKLGGPFAEVLLMMTDNYQTIIDNFTVLNWATVLSSVFCLIGALLMWKLKKVGFYPYILGEIALPIVNIVLVGGVISYIGLFYPVLFVVFYAIHLKHMD